MKSVPIVTNAARATRLERHFRAFIGLPCWDVCWNSYTNVSMSFGKPRLVVRQPSKRLAGWPPRRVRLPHRLVTVHGQWWLWLFWARWTLTIPGLPAVRNTASERRIRAVLRCLNGQRLTSVAISSVDGRTRFEFDLGATLDVEARDRMTDSDIWSLYKPDRRVLSVRRDGSFSLEHGWVETKSYQPMMKPVRKGSR